MKTFTKLAVASAMTILPISAFAQAGGTNGAPAGADSGQVTAPAAKTDLSAPAAAPNGASTQGATMRSMPGMTGGKMDMSTPATGTSAAAGKTEAPAKTVASGKATKSHAATAPKSHVKVMKVNRKVTAPTGVQVKTPDASKS
jgi:hypothetical protein